MSRHPLRRILTTVARMPVLADRRGMRWAINGRVMPGGAIALLTHRGRQTGRVYTTPVEALIEDHDRGEIVITPMRGERSDWYLNVLDGGLLRVRFRGEEFRAGYRILTEDERNDALSRYRRNHPLFGRLVLWGMARKHRRAGDRLAAAAQEPLLALVREREA